MCNKIKSSKIKTYVTDVEPNKIVTMGYSQNELITNVSFSDMVYLLLKGELPSSKESKIFNYTLVSLCDHGVTPPSTQTSRLIASSGSPLNVALSGALLAFGKNHAGAIENSMKLFQDIFNDNYDDIDYFSDLKIEKIANDIVDSYLENNKRIPGFGHRFHTKDPRAAKLMDLVKEEGFIGKHVKLVLAIEKILIEKKRIRINIDGATGAILSDLDFSDTIGIGIFTIGRIPALIAHVMEENTKNEGFRKFCDINDISYCGKKGGGGGGGK